MAVTAVKQVRSGWGADQNRQGQIDFTAHYLVICDDPEDGPQIAAGLGAIALGLPKLNDTYSFGSDVDAGAYAKSIKPSRRGDTLHWDVTVIFGPLDNSDTSNDGTPRGRDANGNPVEDPVLEADQIEVRFTRQTIAVKKAEFLGVLQGGVFKSENAGSGAPAGGTLIVGTEGAVRNSANVTFDPPLVTEYFRMVITITKNLAAYNADLYKQYVNTVNSEDYQINKIGFNLNIAKHTGKLDMMPGQRVSKGNQLFWRVTFQFEVDDILGWREDVHDRGFMASGLPGDPDGHGGTIPSSGDPDAFPAGTSPHRVILDGQGNPVTEPVDLDGKGQPLTPGDATVFLRYKVLPERDWTPLGI